jgi:hypothetical protein
MVLSFLMKGLLGIAACYVWGFTSIRRCSWIVVLAKIHPEQNLTVQRFKRLNGLQPIKRFLTPTKFSNFFPVIMANRCCFGVF